MDGFRNPRAIRYRQGRHSTRGYYEDAYDTSALTEPLLRPLGETAAENGEVWLVQPASFDLDADIPIEGEKQYVSTNGIVIVDGSFLLKLELARMWDYTV